MKPGNCGTMEFGENDKSQATEWASLPNATERLSKMKTEPLALITKIIGNLKSHCSEKMRTKASWND